MEWDSGVFLIIYEVYPARAVIPTSSMLPSRRLIILLPLGQTHRRYRR